MPKLNQVVAVVTTKKSQGNKTLTEVYHKLQKLELFNGISREYTPRADGGEVLPSELKSVEYTVGAALNEVREAFKEMCDVIATVNAANCVAVADVVVGDALVARAVPVAQLLFLEKQLVNLANIIEKIPTLPTGKAWHYDENVAAFAAAPTTRIVSKKIPRNHIKYDATPQHPAQVEVYHEDVPVGQWSVMEYSGAFPREKKQLLQSRIRELHDAVRYAREQANNTEVQPVEVGESIMNYLLADVV